MSKFEKKWRHQTYVDGKPTAEYRTWRRMIRRCESPKHNRYVRYGGRGIKVCKRWRESFDAFVDDMGPKPDGLSLDRIDNDGNYEPTNCRWATDEEQNRNRSITRQIAHDGKTQTLPEWAEETGVPWSVLDCRLRKGWTVARALTTPARTYAKITEREVRQIRERCALGEQQKDVAAAFGIAPQTVSGIVCRRKWAHVK